MQISSRQFNQNVGQAQRAAQNEPVFITNRGVPAYVLLTKADYDRLITPKQNALDVLLNLPDVGNIDLEITPRSTNSRPLVEFE